MKTSILMWNVTAKLKGMFDKTFDDISAYLRECKIVNFH